MLFRSCIYHTIVTLMLWLFKVDRKLKTQTIHHNCIFKVYEERVVSNKQEVFISLSVRRNLFMFKQDRGAVRCLLKPSHTVG